METNTKIKLRCPRCQLDIYFWTTNKLYTIFKCCKTEFLLPVMPEKNILENLKSGQSAKVHWGRKIRLTTGKQSILSVTGINIWNIIIATIFLSLAIFGILMPGGHDFYDYFWIFILAISACVFYTKDRNINIFIDSEKLKLAGKALPTKEIMGIDIQLCDSDPDHSFYIHRTIIRTHSKKIIELKGSQEEMVWLAEIVRKLIESYTKKEIWLSFYTIEDLDFLP